MLSIRGSARGMALAGLAAALLSGASRAQGPEQQGARPPARPLETYGDPPAEAVATPGRSRTRPIVHGTFVTVQVNVDPLGLNILGDAANEPSIALDPLAPQRMAIGWRQFGG